MTTITATTHQKIKRTSVALIGLLAGPLAATAADPAVLDTPPEYGMELGCMAMNIYHEARGENTQGQLAVAAVTMNRVGDKRYPNTVCDVVWQNKQFSWTNLKPKYHVIKNHKAWQEALDLAALFINGGQWPGVGKATHYHANTVSPNWKDDSLKVATVGNHLFYTL